MALRSRISGEMAEGFRVGPGLRLARVDLARQPDLPRLAFLQKRGQAGPEDFRRPAGSRPQGRGAGDEHEVAEDPGGPAAPGRG